MQALHCQWYWHRRRAGRASLGDTAEVLRLPWYDATGSVCTPSQASPQAASSDSEGRAMAAVSLSFPG